MTMKRILSLFLVALLLVAQIPMTVAQASENEAKYTTVLSANAGTRGTEVTVTVNLELPSSMKVNGIELAVEFQTKYFNYTAGSAKPGTSMLEGSTVHYNGNGKVALVWSSKEGVVLPKQVKLFVLTLVVSESSPAATTQITTDMERIYSSELVDGAVQISAINSKGGETPLFTVTSADAEVQNVKNLINAIGQVTYDEATLDRITAAGSAYSKLTIAQREQVSNYNVLIAAEERYRMLQSDGVLPSDVQALINGFLTEHKEVLNLTTEAISTTTDPLALYEKVEAALEDWENLSSPHAQAELIGEKTMLKQFKALLQEKADEQLTQQQEEEYKAKAAELAATFREEYAYTLSRTTDNVKTFDRGPVETAWIIYQANCDIRGVGPYFAALMTEEEALMKALLAKITELETEANPEIAQEILNAQKFKENFAGILALTPEDLVYEDTLDVSLAYMMLEMLDEKTLALLTEEQAIIEALYEAVLELEPDNTTPDPGPDDDDEEQLSAAEIAAEQFRDVFGDVLLLTTNSMSYNDVLDVKLAKTMLDNLDAETVALLSKEQTIIKTLYNKALELEKAEAAKNEMDEATQSAEQWINRFTPVLNLQADNLTQEDALDIKLAKMAYEMLSEEARAKLTTEQEILQALYEKAMTIQPEKEIITEVTEKLIDKNVRVEVVERAPSITIWILLGIAVVAVILYVIVSCRYHGLFSKGGKK